MSFVYSFIADETGAASAEYALMLALIVISIITSLTILGGVLDNSLLKSNTTIDGAITPHLTH